MFEIFVLCLHTKLKKFFKKYIMLIDRNRQPEPQIKLSNPSLVEEIVKSIVEYDVEEQNLIIRQIRDGVRQHRENMIKEKQETIEFIRRSLSSL